MEVGDRINVQHLRNTSSSENFTFIDSNGSTIEVKQRRLNGSSLLEKSPFVSLVRNTLFEYTVLEVLR